MKICGVVSVLTLVLVVASSSYAAPQNEPQEVVVPSQMCGDYYLIPIEVDLDSDGTSTTLMANFDTGGAGLHIDPDAVVRAGGAAVVERKQITIRNATAGPLTFRKLRPYTRHLDHLSRAMGIELDIFLPFRTFKEHLLTLDFPRRELRVARGQLPEPDGNEVFSARGRDGRPYLDTEIAGRTHRLLIDSGSSGSIALKPGRDLPWVTAPIPVSVSQGMEKLYYADIGRIDAQIQIAGVSVTRPIMKIGPTTELIGTQVMRRFSWTFDQRSRRVRIRPDSPDPLRLPSKRGTGAVLFPADEGYEIARGLEETPAARAGLRAGDIVVAANAVRVYEQSCDRWNEEYETETTLTVLRDGETFDLVVEIVDLVP